MDKGKENLIIQQAIATDTVSLQPSQGSKSTLKVVDANLNDPISSPRLTKD
jgi:hypothetical protein